MSHLRPETIFGYEQGLLLPDELRAVHEHVDSCASCRELLAAKMGADHIAAQLKAALAAEAPMPPTKWSFYGLAAGAIPFPLSVLGAWLGMRNRTSTERAGKAATSGWIPYAATAAILMTAVGAWFWLRGRPPVEPELAAMRLPAFLVDLADQRRELMGPGPGQPARLVSPRATAVLGPVSFTWTPVEGEGWRYVLRVFTLDGKQAAASGELTGPAWSTSELPANASYQWQVTATRPGGESITLPGPTDRPPRFRVLAASSASSLPAGSLRRGIACANEGLMDEARRHLQQAAQHDRRAAALLDQLDRRP